MSLVTIHGWKLKQEKYKESGKYSFKAALAIAYIGTIFLWWLPIFGPMLAGYVSGRAAGNKWKGLFSTMIVAATFGVVSYALTINSSLVPGYVQQYFNSSVLPTIGLISPYLGWLVGALKVALTDFNLYVLEIPPQWAVLIAFGFMGGAMSELMTLDNTKKSVLSPRHPKHNDEEAIKPKVVDYEPVNKPHHLIKKVFKAKEKESDTAEPINTKNHTDNDSDEYI